MSNNSVCRLQYLNLNYLNKETVQCFGQKVMEKEKQFVTQSCHQNRLI